MSAPLISEKLFQDGPVVVFVWQNLPGWPVESVTKNIETLYGYLPEDYLNTKIRYTEQIHAEDIQQVVQEVQQASESVEIDSFEHKPYRYKNARGEYRWVKDFTQVVRNSAQEITHYVGYIIDITKEVELRQESDELKERLNLAWSATNDGLWDWRIDENIVYFSPRWKEMIGYAPDEFEDRAEAFFEQIHPEDKPKIEQNLQQHFANPEAFPFEMDLRLRCKNGDYKWIRTRGKTSLDPNGEPCRMVGAHTDISDLKNAQLELLESERRWRAAVDGAGAPCVRIVVA